MKITAAKLIETADFASRRVFDKAERIMPMYHYVTADGSHKIFVPPAFLPDKDHVVAFAKSVFEGDGAVAYAFISEAWALAPPQGTTREEIDLMVAAGIKNHPDRVEVVTIFAEDENGAVSAQIPIHRPPNQKPYLGKLDVWPGGATEGRMVGLLPRKGTVQ